MGRVAFRTIGMSPQDLEVAFWVLSGITVSLGDTDFGAETARRGAWRRYPAPLTPQYVPR